MRHLIFLTDNNHPKQWQLNPLHLCLLNFAVYIPPLHLLIEGIQNRMGIQNIAAIFCIPLIPIVGIQNMGSQYYRQSCKIITPWLLKLDLTWILMILVTFSSQPIRWGTQQKLPCCASKMRFT